MNNNAKFWSQYRVYRWHLEDLSFSEKFYFCPRIPGNQMGKPLQDLSKKINITNSLPSLLEDKKKLSQSPSHNYYIMLLTVWVSGVAKTYVTA